jgi:predicted RNase H-like HicB family nuclease/uncharacterized damage-inducible protein DinB
MTEYAVYLESGPKQRTTMLHVLDLLGCVTLGATTQEALQAAPQAVRTYLSFLKRHGEAVNPAAEFNLRIVQHVMEGVWLGYGDPTPGFAPDFQPVSEETLMLHLRRWGWMNADLLERLQRLTPEQMAAHPEKGRSFQEMLEHVAESDSIYVRYLVGKVDGMKEALATIKPDARAGLPALWQVCAGRLARLTPVELAQQVPHGQVTWSAHRSLRRLMEHTWEHLMEVQDRLG